MFYSTIRAVASPGNCGRQSTRPMLPTPGSVSPAHTHPRRQSRTPREPATMFPDDIVAVALSLATLPAIGWIGPTGWCLRPARGREGFLDFAL